MNSKTKLLIRDAFFSSILSCFIILILVLLVFNIRFFNPLHKALVDFNFLDVYYAEKFHDTTKVNQDIILINVEKKNRLEIAQLLQAVVDGQPKTIGVDIIFKDKKENIFADSLLANLLQENNIITAYDIEKRAVVYNNPYFGNGVGSGYVDFNFDDKSSVIREFDGKINLDNKEHYSFASAIAKHYLKDKWKEYNYDNKLNKSHTIKYIGNYSSFQHLDYEDFNEYETKSILKDKIVILGYLGSPTGSPTDIGDKFFTPLNSIIAGRSDADMYGITIHANITNMLIKNDFMSTISNFWYFVITVFCMFFATMFYMKINKHYKISYRTRKRLFQFGISIIILSLTFWLFGNNIVLKPAPIIVGIVLAGTYFKYYKHLTRYLKTKTNKKWKTYLK